MKRRDLLLATGAWGTLAATRASAQAQKPRVLGWLFAFTKEGQKEMLRDFKSHLARLGQVEGRDYVIEGRWTGGKVEPLAVLARELVALGPAVVVTGGTAAIAALKGASHTVPVVFLSVGDPVASGFVASLARPGGNITGVMLRTELQGKLFDLMREILPAVRRVALLEHASDPVTRQTSELIGRAATAHGIELRAFPVERLEDIDGAFAAAAGEKCGAMLASSVGLLLVHAQAIGALSAKARLPLFSTWRGFTQGGGLLSYFSDYREALSRGAVMTDKILRGANPADLAVEQPDRYTLVINGRTAKTLGIKLPQSVLISADEVLE